MSAEAAGRGLLKTAWGHLRHNRFAMLSLWTLVLFYSVALFADFVAPYHYDTESRRRSFHPPTTVRIRDADGNWQRPFVYAKTMTRDEFRRRIYTDDPSQRLPIKLFVRGDAHKLLWLFETDLHLFGVEDQKQRVYLFGADARGRDLFSRMVYGSRVSLSIGFAGVFLSMLIGLAVGGIAGYFGGRMDGSLMRLCELIMMVPGFYLLLALRAAFPPELGSIATYFLIVVILSFIGWAGTARVIRGMILPATEGPMVQGAKAAGLSSWRVIRRYAIPTTYSYVIVAVTLMVPSYMIGESGLSLLGLGIQDPHASWGNLLQDAMGISEIQLHPWVLTPGFLIFIVTMAFNFLGDGLRDALDPRMAVERSL